MVERFTVDVLLAMTRPTYRMPFSLSVDGRLLALGVSTLSRGESRLSYDGEFDEWGVPVEGVAGSTLVVVDTETGKAEQPFEGASTSWAGQFSPDGSRLAACVQQEGMACLGIWDRRTGSRQLHDVRVHPYFPFEVPCWTPRGDSLVIKVAVEGYDPAPKSEVTGVRVQECDPLRADDNESERYPDIDLGDLALVSVDTGEVRYLAHGWSVRRYRVSPDGRYLATLRMLGNDDKHLCIVSLADGGATTLATGVVQSYANAFNWSPDSASLAYVSDGRLYVVALDSSNPREIGVADARLRWPDVSVHVAPRWSADGRTVYALSRGEVWICAADGSRQRRIDGSDIRRRLRLWVQPAEGNELVPFDGESLLMTTLAPGSLHGGLAQMNLVTGTIELIDEWPRHCSHTSMWMEIDRLQDRAYVVMEGAAEPAAVWRFDKKSMRPETFFVPNSRVPPFGDCRLLEWESLSGAPCEGALVLPPGLDEDAGPLPTVVIHADLDDHHSFGYDAYDVGNPHLLAARGYAVLYLDVNVDAGDPMKAQPGQVLPIVRQMVREGIVDSQRIGAYGICYDAYRVMSVLTQSDVYRAAVCASGTYNLTSTYGRIAYWGWSEFGEEELGGSLWDRRDAHIENSPFFYLDRVQAAVLLISGNGDPNVDTQAEDTYRALSRLGRKVSWRSYPGEPTYSNDWSRAHLRDMCNAALDWFDDNL